MGMEIPKMQSSRRCNKPTGRNCTSNNPVLYTAYRGLLNATVIRIIFMCNLAESLSLVSHTAAQLWLSVQHGACLA